MNPLLSTTHTVKLLGSLQVQHGERRITRFQTYKTASLLAYLVYHPQPHPREVLVEIFWPDGTPERQRNNLSMALSSLRNQLEFPGVPAGAVIVADRQQVGINAAMVETDISRFERALHAASTVQNERQRAFLLQEAVDLYKGELLPGYYEEWIFAERQRLSEAYIQALRRLIRLQVKRKQFDQAIDYSLRRIAADPLGEEAHRDLMNLYAAAGQPSAALRQYRELVRLLERDLQAKPSAATRQAALDIETRLQQATPPVALSRPAPPASRTTPDAPSLPSGTVTFLLSDIVGFTRHWERAGGVFELALETHHALLRQHFARYGGHEFEQVSDSFLVAFERASDALACAIACQRALQQHAWPAEVGPVSVRMALHTGEAAPDGGDYQGPTLDRASRLVAAAHGGQILCSETTVSLLQHLPSEVEMYDMGVFRLRDIPNPEHLFQANYRDMPQREFPAPNADAGYTSHLPLVLTRFFGREKEKARMCAMLLEADTRLVTMTGIGGTGKTRLAMEVARQLQPWFSGAVWFVPLADLSDTNLILSTIATCLRISRPQQMELMDQVAAALSRQPSLLILDNFEQLAEAGGPVVQALLSRVATLTLLVTSRQVLNLSGEREFVLQPLPVPGDAETLENLCLFDSVQLFIDRAQAVKPDFRVTNFNAAALATLCDRLEGIPLAIELAAARAQVLTPSLMLAQMQNRFEFLASRRRDSADRHRTLRAAMEWSYRLLSPDLQRFFARLSVFRGGWSCEGAEMVCEEPLALDHLAQLRECSLVLAEDCGDGIRFRMLETVKEYAAEQMSPIERTYSMQRHLEFYLALAPQTRGAPRGPFFDRVTVERDNLRSVLAWALEADPEAALQLASELSHYWWNRGALREGRAWLDRALKVSKKATSARANALVGLWHVVVFGEGDKGSALPIAQECLAVSRQLDDPTQTAFPLHILGYTYQLQGDYAAARAHFEESLAVAGEEGMVANTLKGLGELFQEEGDYERARVMFEQSLAVPGTGTGAEAHKLNALGHLSAMEGDYATAVGVLHEALAVLRKTSHRSGIRYSLQWLGETALAQESYAQARTYFEESLALARECGEDGGSATTLITLARAAEGEREGYREQVTARCRQSLRLAVIAGDATGSYYIASVLEGFARVAAEQDQPQRAACLFGAAEALREARLMRIWPLFRADYDQSVATTRATTSEHAFSASWARGRTMTLEQAIAYALEETNLPRRQADREPARRPAVEG